MNKKAERVLMAVEIIGVIALVVLLLYLGE